MAARKRAVVRNANPGTRTQVARGGRVTITGGRRGNTPRPFGRIMNPGDRNAGGGSRTG